MTVMRLHGSSVRLSQLLTYYTMPRLHCLLLYCLPVNASMAGPVATTYGFGGFAQPLDLFRRLVIENHADQGQVCHLQSIQAYNPKVAQYT